MSTGGVTRPPRALLDQVVELSRRFGGDPEFARGGGGNSSGKAEGILWIKPSGVSLASLTADSLMPLVLEPLLAVLEREDEQDAGAGSEEVLGIGMAARLSPSDNRRPSVECLFHALLPEPIVIHTHPTTVNALTCAARGREIAADLFGDTVLWIPYVDPGLPLARRIAEERRLHAARTGRAPPAVMLLQNHGLIVAGASPSEIMERSARVADAVRPRIEAPEGAGTTSDTVSPPSDEGARSRLASEHTGRLATAIADTLADERRADGSGPAVLFDDSPLALRLGSTPDGHAFVRGGPLTPDQIVYAGSSPLLIEQLPSEAEVAEVADVVDVAGVVGAVRARLEEHVAATGGRPSIVVVAGLGLFAVADNAKLAAAARDVYLDAARVARGAARLGGVRPMAPEERRFIEEWEAETYRRGITAAAG
jgi:rhamnulokinase